MKIETIETTSNFESKTQHQAFRQAWKDYHADGKHLKQETEAYDGSKHQISELDCVHHLIYAVMRGRDLKKSFAPLSERKRMGRHPYQAFYDTKNIIKAAANSRFPDRYKYLFAPFASTIDLETIKFVANQIEKVEL